MRVYPHNVIVNTAALSCATWLTFVYRMVVIVEASLNERNVPMERKIIPFRAIKSNPVDVAAAVRLFSPALEWQERRATIPQAQPTVPKSVY
jgi:hypothetical protein